MKSILTTLSIVLSIFLFSSLSFAQTYTADCACAIEDPSIGAIVAQSQTRVYSTVNSGTLQDWARSGFAISINSVLMGRASEQCKSKGLVLDYSSCVFYQ